MKTNCPDMWSEPAFVAPIEVPEEDREDLSEKYDYMLWLENGCIYGVKGDVAYDVYFDCGFPEKIPE